MKERAIIAGSGFGGLETALKLRERNKDIEIIVIDKNPVFVYKPSLPKIISGKIKAKRLTINLQKVYKKHNIRFYKEEIIEVKPLEKSISTISRKLNFDYLVITIGSVTNFFSLEGVKDYSFSLKRVNDALKIRKELDEILEKSRHYSKPVTLTVCGGGLTGIEVASELADAVKRKAKIIISEESPKLMKSFPNLAVSYAEKILKKKGVEIAAGQKIKRAESGKVSFSDGHDIYTSMNIWCGGVKANPLTHKTGLRTNDMGAIMVNDFLQTSHPHIFAIGDCAYMYKNPQPLTAQLAIRQAEFAAYNIDAYTKKKDKKAFIPKEWPYAVSLGRGRAILIRKNRVRTGFIPSLIKKFIEKHYMFTRKNWYWPFKNL